MKNSERLLEIKQQIRELVEEAITLLPKGSTVYKMSSVYWYYTIKLALGHRNSDHLFSIDDAAKQLQEIGS